MDFSLDTLRNALLLTLIIMLVIVLYKRLLRFLGKKDKAAYAHLADEAVSVQNGHITVRFNLPEQGKTRLELRDESNKILQVIIDEADYPQQDHEVLIDVSALSPGRYSYHLITHNQQSQRFFTV